MEKRCQTSSIIDHAEMPDHFSSCTGLIRECTPRSGHPAVPGEETQIFFTNFRNPGGWVSP